jgi:acetyl esterase
MPDPQTRELLDRLGDMTRSWARDHASADIGALRAYASDIFAAFAGPERDLTAFTRRDIRTGPPSTSRPARLYRPLGDGIPPIIMFFHGGGWALGGLDEYDGLVGSLCALSGAALVSVDYRLAPEHPFPAGLDDAVAATEWVARHADALGVDADRLAVMGDSAGGNLAGVIAHEALARGGPLIVAQYLLYPVLDVATPDDAFPSRMAFGNGDLFLTRGAIAQSAERYLIPGQRADDARVSPLLAGSLAGLPPALILCGSHDPLLDESVRYAERLSAAGVSTQLEVIDGGVHAFLSFGTLDLAQRGRRIVADHVRRTLIPNAGGFLRP